MGLWVRRVAVLQGSSMGGRSMHRSKRARTLLRYSSASCCSELLSARATMACRSASGSSPSKLSSRSASCALGCAPCRAACRGQHSL